MKIVIIGASGFLGTKLRSIFSKDNEVIGADVNENNIIRYLDATDFEEVKDFLTENKPEIVISTVGISDYKICEKNPELAEKINYLTAKNITEASRLINSKVIFISSIYVFDGKEGNYSEEDLPNPINVYGKTKLIAEQAVLDYYNSVVLRVDLLYGYNGKHQDNGLIDELFPKERVEIRNPEQMRHPILIDDVAKIINFLIKENKTGIFHIAGQEKIKKYDFIKTLCESLNVKCGVSVNENFNLENNLTFDLTKLENLRVKTTSLEDSIKKLHELLKH